MSNFDETIARMKSLYTYGKGLYENKEVITSNLEYHKIAADGKSYGIIKECNKYYIKSAPKSKENLAEAYNYIGGFCNKKQYEYDSYSNALKNLEMKLSSINEACDGNVNISTLDPFRKEIVIAEATDKMKDEIARCRQIMYNTAMIMNEATEIGAGRKDDVVMYYGENPEAEKGKTGDEEYTETKADPDYKGSDTNGVDKKVGPFNCDPSKELNENSVCEKCGGNANECNCSEYSEMFDVETGVGVADTDKNNQPFTQTVNENEEEDEETFEVSVDDFDTEDEIEDTDETLPVEISDEAGDEFDQEENQEEESDEIVDSEEEETNDNETDEFDDEETYEFTDEFNADDFDNTELSDEFNDEETAEEFDDEETDEFDTEEIDECGFNKLMEARLNKVVNSVVSEILKEEKLNDFGKHPGYRKKPMELPITGEDKNQWGKDINDESTHSDKPFGEKIGDGDPFKIFVDKVTSDVMQKLMENKKKVK